MLKHNPGRMAEIKRGWRQAAARDAIADMRMASGCCVKCGAYCNATRGVAGYCGTCLRQERAADGLPYVKTYTPPAGTAAAAEPRRHWRDYIPIDC